MWRVAVVLAVVAGVNAEGLDLASRLGRQLDGNGEGGVALGLVSALQQWSDSLESKTSNLRSELQQMKTTNRKIQQETQQIKSSNINLRNDVAQANERTMNLKNNYQKATQQLVGLRAEQEGQRKLLQRQEGFVKALQAQLQESKEEAASLRTQLSSTSSSLSSLQGNVDTLSGGVADRLGQIQPRLDTLASSLNALSSNTSAFHSATSAQLAGLEEATRQQAGQATTLRQDMEQTDRDNMVAVRDIVTKLDTRLRSDITKRKEETEKVERRVEEVVTALGGRVKANSDTVAELRAATSDAHTNLGMIKQEIEQSVSFLTGEMAKNVTAKVEELEAEIEANTGRVQRSINSLSTKSSLISAEMNKLRSHAQRSVDASSGVKVNLDRLEGKVAEVVATSTGLLDKLGDLDRSVEDVKAGRRNTLRTIQGLGDTVDTLRADIAGKDLKGGLGDLVDKSLALEKSVAELSVKAVRSQQDLIRNTGRINKVEQDMGLVRGEVAGVREETSRLGRVTAKELNAVTDATDTLRAELEGLEQTVTTTRNAVAEVMTKQESLESQGVSSGVSKDTNHGALASTVATLKTNVIGLGNYINSINREVNGLASRTKDSVDNLNQQVTQLTSTINTVKSDVATGPKSGLDFGSSDTSSLKTDVAGLSSQLFTLKTSVFEMSGDVSGVKSGLQGVKSDVKSVKTSLKDLSSKVISGEQLSKTTRDQLSTVRSSVSGISSSLFSLRSSVKSLGAVEDEVEGLTKNMSSISTDVAKLQPELEFLVTDVTSVRNGVTRLTRALQLLSDPPRFSCGVTGEELKVSGVITYDECTVNFNKMMNTGTGHATVPAAGDYMLSFTANMVSSNSQAIWCALYKQSPGDEGWQVLGMINNYQRDAGEEDDRDSGSLSLLATLKEGDQVWVEWRGYGDSFLYSNPYKLISFSGYLVTRAS